MPATPQSVLFTPRQLVRNDGGFPFDLRVLSRSDDRSDVFRLRYEAYRADGHISESGHGTYSDDRDDAPETVQFAAYDGGRCVGAFRMTFKGWSDPISVLPCAPYYPALQSAGLRKLSIAEVSRMAIDPALSNRSYRTTLYGALVRAGLLAGQSARVAMLVVATKPEWVRFYTQMLRFHPIGEPARYPPGDIDITLLGGNMVDAGARHIERNRFFQTSPSEIASMRTALARTLGPSPHSRVLSHDIAGPGA